MNTTKLGKTAEQHVASMLRNSGYEIAEMNWRTRRCEIDIIAIRNNTAYFIEVKYRSSSIYGNGLQYVTQSKQRQMRYAAQSWVMHSGWSGRTSLIAAAVDPGLCIQFASVI